MHGFTVEVPKLVLLDSQSYSEEEVQLGRLLLKAILKYLQVYQENRAQEFNCLQGLLEEHEACVAELGQQLRTLLASRQESQGIIPGQFGIEDPVKSNMFVKFSRVTFTDGKGEKSVCRPTEIKDHDPGQGCYYDAEDISPLRDD